SLPDADVSLQVERGQARVRLVPDVRGHLVATQVLLEFALVTASVQKEPVRPGVSDAVAEDDVEPEADFVDEVVHVALETAVIVAEKYDPLAVVEKHPAREMNRAHAGQS